MFCQTIKSLIKKVFPDRDVTFNKAKVNVFKALFAPFIWTGRQGMNVRFYKFADRN